MKYSPSEKVVRTVADAEGEDPGELDPPLFDVVDPDALDSIFESVDGVDRGTGTIRFQYLGYRVTVLADSSVSIQGQTSSATDSS